MKKLTEICHYESSMIESSFYNFQTEKLLVEFNGGALYEFMNVPESNYRSFSESDSVGRAFNEFIRPYEGTKIEETQIFDREIDIDTDMTGEFVKLDNDIRQKFPSNIEGSEEFNQGNKN